MAGLLDVLFGGGQNSALPWFAGQQAQQQPQEQPQPQLGTAPAAGTGNPFLAGLLSLTGSHTPLGGLGNMIGGFATGQRTDPLAIEQNANIRDFLFKKAEAARNQGNVERELELKEAPDFTTIGQSLLGQPQYGFVNKLKQSITPATATTTGTNSAGIDDSKPIYGQLPKQQQGIVDAMLEGRQAMPSSFALKTPYWNTLIAAAHEKAQETGSAFDATIWGQRNSAAKDLSPQGKSGQTINALDTVQGHIEKLSNSVEKLDNGDWPFINYAKNAIATQTPFNKERVQNLQSLQDARKAVVDEMARAYKGGHMSDAEIRDWSALISAADSKTKMRQALADFTELLNTKRDALVNQYRGLNVPFKGANNAQNERVTGLVHDRNAGVTPQVPGSMLGHGEVITGGGAAPAAPETRVLNGKNYIKQNGQWYQQ